MNLEERVRALSQRPSQSEQDRIDSTLRVIKSAIDSSNDIRLQNAKIFAKGSVRMRTNISRTSDIDICVQAGGVFYADYPKDKDQEFYGNTSSDYTFADFRLAVEEILVQKFGPSLVDITGKKAIRINGSLSGSRIDADVVPAFEHRRYTSNSHEYIEGIELKPKGEFQSIINWPEQNYENSLGKHENTYRRYRKMVRIIKRIREMMKEDGENIENGSQSFLIESLLWNVPKPFYGNPDYVDDIRGILGYLKEQLSDRSIVHEWGEVNELKYLFRDAQKWTINDALAFINKVEHYLENKV